MRGKIGRLSWAVDALVDLYESKFQCYVVVSAGLEGWVFRTRKWFVGAPWPALPSERVALPMSSEEAAIMAFWDALDICALMRWEPDESIRWFNTAVQQESKRLS